MNYICTKCGTVGKPKTVTPGYLILEALLWCCFLLPGIIYSYWRHGARHKACKACRSRDVVSTDTPIGKMLVTQLAAQPIGAVMTR